jgi:hypothetical protein
LSDKAVVFSTGAKDWSDEIRAFKPGAELLRLSSIERPLLELRLAVLLPSWALQVRNWNWLPNGYNIL